MSPLLVVFLPLVGAIFAGLMMLAPRTHGRDVVVGFATSIAVLASWILSAAVLNAVVGGGEVIVVKLADWFASGGFASSWSVRVDTLTAVMLFVVTSVSAMVHFYSIGYMHGDAGFVRFMSYLGLFTFFMLMLVTSDDLMQLFFGWEGVGLASYLLIGFWYEKKSASDAAVKAFVVNRVADVFFAVGVVAAYYVFDSVRFETIFAKAAAGEGDLPTVVGLSSYSLVALLLFIGAMGKSAQLGFHTWLPDAMEGPTPVSALIHAATMVTAGVFLVARMSPLFVEAPGVLDVVAVVGAATAFFAATVACAQNDIKRIIAYSTCSQLGYMFLACGVTAFSAGIFHLFTHAFFKALLFLGAGSVIHALHGEQDIRKMGGLYRVIPITYGLMVIGSLALAGVWPFAGYWSKDVLLEATFASGGAGGVALYLVGVFVALLTAFYSTRLLVLVFHGERRFTEAHPHESPKVMVLPMAALAVGAIVAGFVGESAFVGEAAAEFWVGPFITLGDTPLGDEIHHVPSLVVLGPSIAALLGIALGCAVYLRATPQQIAKGEPDSAFYRFLARKWYFDELYDAIFVKPALRLADVLWKQGDVRVIDGGGPGGLTKLALGAGAAVVRLNRGFISDYASVMALGLIVLAPTLYLLLV